MAKNAEKWLDEVIERSQSGVAERRYSSTNKELDEKCGLEDQDTWSFRATRRQIFSLMEVTDPENVLSLLCGTDIRTGEAASEYLTANGLSKLVTDNTEHVAGAVARKSDLASLVDMVLTGYRTRVWKYEMRCSWADLADFLSSSLGEYTDLEYLLADGDVSWTYIKEVGITNTRKYHEQVMSALSKLSAAETKAIITKAVSDKGLMSWAGYSMTSRERVDLYMDVALAIGYDAVMSLHNPDTFTKFIVTFRRSPLAAECLFLDEMLRLLNDPPKHEWVRIQKYYDAGLEPEESAAYYKSGISPQRGSEIASEGITGSVAGGWL